MKKAVIFDFPEDFLFPENFNEETCIRCPLCTFNAIEEMACFLTGETYPSIILCPFCGGSEAIIYDETQEAG